MHTEKVQSHKWRRARLASSVLTNGYCLLVQYMNPVGAEIAIKALNKQLFEGRTVTVIVSNAASIVVHQQPCSLLHPQEGTYFLGSGLCLFSKMIPSILNHNEKPSQGCRHRMKQPQCSSAYPRNDSCHYTVNVLLLKSWFPPGRQT